MKRGTDVCKVIIYWQVQGIIVGVEKVSQLHNEQKQGIDLKRSNPLSIIKEVNTPHGRTFGNP